MKRRPLWNDLLAMLVLAWMAVVISSAVLQLRRAAISGRPLWPAETVTLVQVRVDDVALECMLYEERDNGRKSLSC